MAQIGIGLAETWLADGLQNTTVIESILEVLGFNTF